MSGKWRPFGLGISALNKCNGMELAKNVVLVVSYHFDSNVVFVKSIL